MEKFKRKFVATLKKRLKDKNPLIQVVMGPRQVGKTTGILQLVDSYKEPVHYVMADDVIAGDRDWIILQWQNALRKGKNTLLIIDEIQKIDNWTEIVKKLWDEQKIKKTNIKLIILGSSSLTLTKGVNESLAGRFEKIDVYHWDFVESKDFCKMSLDVYLQQGGYPKSYDFLDDYDRWKNYLSGSIISRVIDVDILNFAGIKNPSLFRQAFEVVCSYPAQEISFRKMLGQIQDKGNVDLIKNYLNLLEGAYLIKALSKYSNQEFKVKSSSPKIVILAPCLYEIVSVHRDKEEFVFESTVGAKLLQLSQDLYYWRQGNDEVDFILKWRGNIYAVEVKSGRKKKALGLKKFIEQNPNSLPVIITRDNYIQFIKDPEKFLQKMT